MIIKRFISQWSNAAVSAFSEELQWLTFGVSSFICVLENVVSGSRLLTAHVVKSCF